MNTGITHFQKGNSAAKGKLGKKHKLTILREKIGIKNIEDLKEDALNIWVELIYSNDIEYRKFAVKEVSKYIFSTQKPGQEKSVTIMDVLDYLKEKEIKRKEQENQNSLTKESIQKQ